MTPTNELRWIRRTEQGNGTTFERTCKLLKACHAAFAINRALVTRTTSSNSRISPPLRCAKLAITLYTAQKTFGAFTKWMS